MSAHERVLVTGGAGMIGRRVVRKLIEQGAEVGVLDNLSSGLSIPEGVMRAVVGDIRDVDLVSQLCRSFRPQSIVHLAAVHHIPTCEHQRAYCLDVNVTGTENVLHAAEVAGIERVLIASSGAVYAWSEEALLEDSSPLWSCDNYSAAKTINENQLRFWTDRTGGIGRAARIFNTLGHDDPNAHLLPDIVAQLQGGVGPCVIRLGNLIFRRDYIHAEDVASGLIELTRDIRTNITFDTFNLCLGKEYSVEQFIKIIAKILDRELKIEVDELRKRRVDRLSQLGSRQKGMNLLNWSPAMSLEDALKTTIRNMAINES